VVSVKTGKCQIKQELIRRGMVYKSDRRSLVEYTYINSDISVASITVLCNN